MQYLKVRKIAAKSNSTPSFDAAQIGDNLQTILTVWSFVIVVISIAVLTQIFGG